ncbi:P-loop ATPase, Sll1717 family [Mesorhizobium muleiense]|uniref:P-loop ATPase, Sll1717 family n=1 Tax=Mesorhizobium muleiense TaxID=1004279 RepID=UPI001F3DA9B2|nr:hypothetical protein [Mesorhizobium muleiense]MCF6114146.1 hypothetical protein [Mesorhizobium muleiense]
MAKRKHTNPIRLNDGMTIGSLAAETDDDYLFDCFVHYPPVDIAMKIDSHGSILTGRTGAGKTAIIRYIATHVEHSVQIQPSDMAMSYVSNSDALLFLHAIGADLDLLFQALWKHVLCIEFIRLRWAVTDSEKSRSIFGRIAEKFSRDQRKQKALRYLREWEGEFWITMDENIKTITERVEKKVEAELGGEIKRWKARGQYDKQMSVDKKTDLVRRVRSIISGEQLSELSGVIDILSEFDASEQGQQSKYYILIDKLDENWVDTSVRFRLIRALIETVKTFRRVRNLKVLVAMRTDILERVVQETKDISYQREKSEEYFIKMKWNRPQLRLLADTRILKMYRRQYTAQDVHFADLFPYQINRTDAIDYIIDRTLMRPRDVIAFVNECLRAADGTLEVTATHVRRGEIEYSRLRREALEHEWQSAFPTLKLLLDFIAETRKEAFQIGDMTAGSRLEQLGLNVASEPKIDFDPTHAAATAFCESPAENAFLFAKGVAAILYRVGAVGLKLDPGDRFRYSHQDEPIISVALIPDEAKVRVHPMLHGALKINLGH